ncbi:MAG: hypothetical protein JRI68_15185 [Deltaproteobacteria bacterium]|nr:hypothetical protein [Deltaproteobacteria bacterium]
MLASPATAEEPREDAEVHELKTGRTKIGPFALLLAAALVATTAVGMYGARQTTTPPAQSSLPVIVPPKPTVAPTAAPEVAMEAAEIEGRRPRRAAPPPKPSAEPEPEPAPEPPKYIRHPRCDCVNDVAVCSCLGI